MPHTTLYLDVQPETCNQRILGRGRVEYILLIFITVTGYDAINVQDFLCPLQWNSKLKCNSQIKLRGGSMATLWVGTSPASGHQPAPSHRRNFNGETYLTGYLPWTTPYEGWEGLGTELAKSGPKQWSTKLNWASKLPIWWPKQWSVQGSDPQRSAPQTTAFMVTRAQMQAHGKASPCTTPQILETAERFGSRLTKPKLH